MGVFAVRNLVPSGKVWGALGQFSYVQVPQTGIALCTRSASRTHFCNNILGYFVCSSLVRPHTRPAAATATRSRRVADHGCGRRVCAARAQEAEPVGVSRRCRVVHCRR